MCRVVHSRLAFSDGAVGRTHPSWIVVAKVWVCERVLGVRVRDGVGDVDEVLGPEVEATLPCPDVERAGTNVPQALPASPGIVRVEELFRGPDVDQEICRHSLAVLDLDPVRPGVKGYVWVIEGYILVTCVEALGRSFVLWRNQPVGPIIQPCVDYREPGVGFDFKKIGSGSGGGGV